VTQNRKKGTGRKEQGQRTGPSGRLSVFGAAAPPQTDRPPSAEQGDVDIPLIRAGEFQQFLERWATILPLSPLASGDVVAWATEWDNNEALRDGWGSLMLIIESDDFFSGRKLGNDGQPFVMLPRYLLREQDGQPRWAGVLLGTLGSAGQTIARLGLLNPPESESAIPTCVWDDELNGWRRVNIAEKAAPEGADFSGERQYPLDVV
jgi:hypothetical protein